MKHLYGGLSSVVLALLSYFYFPGHTILQSDTQIYLPILERFWDASVFAEDMVATRPHVAYTLYDETAIALRRITGLPFEAVLTVQQVVYRALGIFGVYLIAMAAALPAPISVLVAAMYALGATIMGPAVLTVEYEPVPRGFAVPLILLAIGLSAHGRMLGSAMAGAIATLYHPPTVYPFAIIFTLMMLGKRHWRTLLVFLSGAIVVLIASRLQSGLVEHQTLFSTIDAELERLQRLRGAYSWVSIWLERFFWENLVLFAASLLATWRIWKFLPPHLKPFLAGLPLIGALSVPASYLLLERMKWAMMPQFQPARALLFVTAVAAIAGAIAGAHAAIRRRWLESAAWFVFVLAIPAHPRLLQILWPDLANPRMRTRAFVVLGLAALTLLALWVSSLRPRFAVAVLALATAAPFVAFPKIAEVANYAPLHTPDLAALSAWARASTPPDAVFLFPDSGQELIPGIFRARALRTVYVDWKSGGQVNFLPSFAADWWRRWDKLMSGNFEPSAVSRFREAGIDYIVLKPKSRLPGARAEFENAQFVVYKTAPVKGQPLPSRGAPVTAR